MKNHIVLILAPISFLGGFGLFEIVQKITGENMSIFWNLFSSIFIGVIILIIESRHLINVIENDKLKNK